VRTYLFLRPGASSRLSGVAWPQPEPGSPGAWIAAAPGSDAVRGYRSGDLPYWLDDELWEVELGGKVEERERLLVGERGRLIRRVPAWDAACADALTESCAWRVRDEAVAALREQERAREARELESCRSLDELEHVGEQVASGAAEGSLLAGLAADVVRYARDAGFGPIGAAVAAYVTAHALAGGERSSPGYDERFHLERARQAAWLSARLGV
jgi:hypothetical protein